MPTRRDVLLLAGAMLTPPLRLRAAEAMALRIGLLEFGTVGWEIEAMRRAHLDAAEGITIETVKLASNDAARIAFLGGAVDAIVADLLWAARMRSEGRNIVFLPFSSTEGALMVPAGSAIAGLPDLPGKRLGVAGGALDKTWLLLQAMARKTSGFDLAAATQPVFGAPPLLSHQLEAGALDAALLFWTFCARLEAKGFRRLIGADDIARAMGLRGSISFLGYVFDVDRLAGKTSLIAAFASASRRTKESLASDDADWAAVRPLMQAEDDATFETLRRRFVEGIPRRPIGEERDDAARLYAVLADIGGDRLLGPAKALPAGLYWTGAE